MARLNKDIKTLFKNVKVKLGAPIRPIHLEDDQLCSLLEMCVEDYAEKVQNWVIENQWSSLYGKDISTTDMAFALSVRTFDLMKDYTYWFSKEVGLQQRGPWEMKKDFVTVEMGKQNYIIPENREINKVLYMTPPTTQTAVMANYGGIDVGLGFGGMAQLGGGYGTSNGPMGGFFIAPAYDTMLLASDLQMKQRMLRSDMTYKVTGGPNGTKILHLLSTPGSKLSFAYNYGQHGSVFGLSGSHVWYTYYDTTGKDPDECALENEDVLLTPDQVPLNKMDYSVMNEPTRAIIRQLLVAESKILIGNIRGYASGKVSIPSGEMSLDYNIMLEQGKAEKEQVLTKLEERLTRMSPQAQLETMAKMSNSMNEIKKMQPVPGWLVI